MRARSILNRHIHIFHILAPHALCWTDECFGLNGRAAITSLIDVARGVVPRNVVNREALAHPRLRHLRPREDG